MVSIGYRATQAAYDEVREHLPSKVRRVTDYVETIAEVVLGELPFIEMDEDDIRYIYRDLEVFHKDGRRFYTPRSIMILDGRLPTERQVSDLMYELSRANRNEVLKQ